MKKIALLFLISVVSFVSFSSYSFAAGGEGSATISPSDLPAGQLLGSVISTFTVGAAGIETTGKVVFITPDNWADAQDLTPGGYTFVTATCSASVALTVTVSTGPSAVTIIPSGTIPGGAFIYLNYQNVLVPYQAKQGVALTVKSVSNSSGILTPISISPTFNIIAGSLSWIGFENWNLTTKVGDWSAAIKVKFYDNYYNSAQTTGTLTISLAGKINNYLYNTTTYMYGYESDADAQFSSAAGGTPVVTKIDVPAGQSEAVFYYKTSTAGQNIIELKYINAVYGYESSSTLWVTAISGGIENPVVYTNSASKGISATITPDGDGVDDRAYIDFGLNSSVSWDVAVATSADCTSPVWTYWGYGVPASGQVSWEGSYAYWDPIKYVWHSEKAPKGTYYVRIQLAGGGIKTTPGSLTIKVETLEITGTVTEDGTSNRISDVNVYAYGPSYSYAVTDSTGAFKLSGLKQGTYNISFSKFGYAYEQKSNVAAGTSADATLKKPAYLKVNVQRGVSVSATDDEAWGSINVFSANVNSYNSYYGSLHFALDVSTSDNGMWSGDISKNYLIENSTSGEIYQAGRWSILQVVPGTYNMKVTLQNDTSDFTNITINSGETAQVSNIFFPRKKAIKGWVVLPSTPAYESWVSLEAKKAGEYYPSAWGWTSISVNNSSASYRISGIGAGEYEIKAFVPGYRKGTSTVTMAAGDDEAVASTITLTTGGGLTGNITVEGDTTDTSLSLYGDPYSIWLSAWSPDSYSYGWTQINMSKNASQAISPFSITGLDDGTYWVSCWLDGFELENSVGWGGVKTKVTNGAGSLNIKLKRYSGKINVKCIVPNDDYANLTVTISGPSLWTFSDISPASDFNVKGGTWTAATGTMSSPKVGTGFYQVTAKYTTTGIEKTKSIMTSNGQESNITLDLSGETYYIKGKVEISKTNPPEQPFTTISSIVSSAAVSGTTSFPPTWLSTTSFRVAAIPYTAASSDSKNHGYSMTAYKNGVIGTDGSFRIDGLVPGVYSLKFPYSYGSSSIGLDLDNNYGNGYELYSQGKVVYVNGNIDNETIELKGGYKVSGKISLPEGENAVTRDFYLYIFDASKYTMNSWDSYIGNINVSMSNSASANFEIKRLPPGEYVLSINDWGYWDNTKNQYVPRQYAAASLKVKVENTDLSGKDIKLSKGGSIKFKLKDASSGAVITPANKSKLLPQSYSMYAVANPWVEGGWGTLDNISGTSGSGGSDYFEVKYLPKGTYDLSLGQDSYGMGGGYSTGGTSGGSGGGNVANYAAQTISGLKLDDNQVVDLGTIEIKQGISVSGTVKDKSGNGIANIPVVANPSLTNEWQSQLRGFTDISGNFNISGLNPDNEYYDLIACPRIDLGGFYFYGIGGIQYGEKVRPMIKIAETTTADFVLEKAEGSITGKVITEDGGTLQNPLDTNLPTAKVFLQQENTIPRTNPIGDIMADTDFKGLFSIEALAPGNYNMMVLSGGYASASKTITVTNTAADAGTLTLKRGAKLAGNITKPDSSNPSTTEVRSIIAVNDDMSEMLIGSLKTVGGKSVAGYEINGFQKDTNYNIIFLSEENELVSAAAGFSVAYSSYVNTAYNLTFQYSAPAVFSRVRKDGSVYYIYFDLTGSLRKAVPDDSDLTKIITLATGNGTLANRYMAPSRKILSCTYTPASAETVFSIKLKAYSRTVNPNTGTEFLIDETFKYFAGVGAKNSVKVSNLRGGKISLDGDSSNIQFAPKSFGTDSGTSFSTATVSVDFARAENVSDFTKTSNVKAMSIPRAAAAYPKKMYNAMKLAQSAAISPLSSFYEILLPAGISRTLKKSATLSLQYSSGADPAAINIYYYDDKNNVYLLENKDRKVDTDAKTLSVSVAHTSVFVIVQSAAAVIAGDAYAGPLFVYNFPNPFGMSATKNLLSYNPQNLPAGQDLTTTGTYIKYGLPQGIKGEVKIMIYNVAGELVREFTETAATDGKYYFTQWDGNNDSGKAVASGVYIARFTVDGANEKFFKIAVIR